MADRFETMALTCAFRKPATTVRIPPPPRAAWLRTCRPGRRWRCADLLSGRAGTRRDTKSASQSACPDSPTSAPWGARGDVSCSSRGTPHRSPTDPRCPRLGCANVERFHASPAWAPTVPSGHRRRQPTLAGKFSEIPSCPCIPPTPTGLPRVALDTSSDPGSCRTRPSMVVGDGTRGGSGRGEGSSGPRGPCGVNNR